MKNVKIRNTSEQSMAACLRRRGSWLHVSQWFKPVVSQDANGVATVEFMPQITKAVPGRDGKMTSIPIGSTYNVGNNAFKRLRRSYGLSLRQAARLNTTVPA